MRIEQRLDYLKILLLNIAGYLFVTLNDILEEKYMIVKNDAYGNTQLTSSPMVSILSIACKVTAYLIIPVVIHFLLIYKKEVLLVLSNAAINGLFIASQQNDYLNIGYMVGQGFGRGFLNGIEYFFYPVLILALSVPCFVYTLVLWVMEKRRKHSEKISDKERLP